MTKEAPSPGRPVRVLLVEDDKEAADCLAVLLREWGHEVSLAHNGPAALAAARAGPPETVLLDIGLPGMDGYEVARRLRGQAGLEKALVVALTGYGDEEDQRRAHQAGFDLHLVKPVNPLELQEVLAHPEAFGQWQGHDG